MIWRIATDVRIKGTLAEILNSWDLHTLYEAHDVLNALDEAEAAGRARSQSETT